MRKITIIDKVELIKVTDVHNVIIYGNEKIFE